MDSYLPDAQTRRMWLDTALKEKDGRRRTFWASLPELPDRPKDSHKGTYGTALAVGGSRGMTGAIALTGAACLRAGAGLTRLVIPDSVLEIVAQFEREYTTIPAPCDSDGRFSKSALQVVLDQASNATAVAVGPGLGRSKDLGYLVRELFFELDKPAVFDADALNALAAAGVFDPSVALTRVPRGPRVFTPHPGEFARMTGVKPGADQASRTQCAGCFTNAFNKRVVEAAGRLGLPAYPNVLVLKGTYTLIAGFDSASNNLDLALNATGNPNLSTGGSGDVLTGIILGLLAQKTEPFAASRLGVMLHGLSADLRATICSRGGVASDVVRFLPCAFDFYVNARRACDLAAN